MIYAIDVGINKIVTRAISFDFKRIQELNVPFCNNQKLIQLLGEVLDSELNADFDSKVGISFIIQLLEVLASTDVVRAVLPCSIESFQQCTSWGSSD